jgi:hypothetical protein
MDNIWLLILDLITSLRIKWDRYILPTLVADGFQTLCHLTLSDGPKHYSI